MKKVSYQELEQVVSLFYILLRHGKWLKKAEVLPHLNY